MLQHGECLPCYSCQNAKGILVTAITRIVKIGEMRVHVCILLFL